MSIGAPCSCSRRTYSSACVFERARVGVLNQARGRTAQVDECGGVDDSVAVDKRLLDGARVRHVADHDVGGNEAVRLEHEAHLGGVAHQQPDIVPGGDERTHGVRAGETRGACNKYLHPLRSCCSG